MTNLSNKLIRAGRDAARLARLEEELRRHPNDNKLRIQVATAQKRLILHQKHLDEELTVPEIDLIDYRIVRREEQYPLLGVSESLSSFQRSLTAVYDSLQSGPKHRARFSAEAFEATRIDFGYSYPGSCGFVLMVRNEQNLFGGMLDDVAVSLLDYFEISGTDDAIEASRTLGMAAVSELYNWVKINSDWNHSVDLYWKRSSAVHSGRYIDADTFHFLEEVFSSAEDREEDQFTVDGVLVGLDVNTKRFHFAVPEGESIKGAFSEQYDPAPVTVPGRYRAIVKRITKKSPASGKESSSFELLGLVERS